MDEEVGKEESKDETVQLVQVFDGLFKQRGLEAVVKYLKSKNFIVSEPVLIDEKSDGAEKKEKTGLIILGECDVYKINFFGEIQFVLVCEIESVVHSFLKMKGFMIDPSWKPGDGFIKLQSHSKEEFCLPVGVNEHELYCVRVNSNQNVFFQ